MRKKPTVMDSTEELEASIFYAQQNGMLHSDFTKEDKNNVKIMMEYAQQVSREVAIEFGLWVRENVGKENFDFAEGDTYGWFDEWKSKQENK